MTMDSYEVVKLSNGNSAEASTSPSPAPSSIGNSAPKYGTLVPNRVFVGGISSNTTEQDLLDLFAKFGKVKATKVISDRAGVSKGYGFVTFETEEEARKLTQEAADNIMLKDRKLNIAPAIKKQVSDLGYIKPYSPRLPDGTTAPQAVIGSNGTVFFGNPATYGYPNHMSMLTSPTDYHQSMSHITQSMTVPGVPTVPTLPTVASSQSSQHHQHIPVTFPSPAPLSTHSQHHPTTVSPHTPQQLPLQMAGTQNAAAQYHNQFVYPQPFYFNPHQYQPQAQVLPSQWTAPTSPQWRWVSPAASYGQHQSDCYGQFSPCTPMSSAPLHFPFEPKNHHDTSAIKLGDDHIGHSLSHNSKENPRDKKRGKIFASDSCDFENLLPLETYPPMRDYNQPLSNKFLSVVSNNSSETDGGYCSMDLDPSDSHVQIQSELENMEYLEPPFCNANTSPFSYSFLQTYYLPTFYCPPLPNYFSQTCPSVIGELNEVQEPNLTYSDVKDMLASDPDVVSLCEKGFTCDPTLAVLPPNDTRMFEDKLHKIRSDDLIFVEHDYNQTFTSESLKVNSAQIIKTSSSESPLYNTSAQNQIQTFSQLIEPESQTSNCVTKVGEKDANHFNLKVSNPSCNPLPYWITTKPPTISSDFSGDKSSNIQQTTNKKTAKRKRRLTEDFSTLCLNSETNVTGSDQECTTSTIISNSTSSSKMISSTTAKTIAIDKAPKKRYPNRHSLNLAVPQTLYSTSWGKLTHLPEDNTALLPMSPPLTPDQSPMSKSRVSSDSSLISKDVSNNSSSNEAEDALTA